MRLLLQVTRTVVAGLLGVLASASGRCTLRTCSSECRTSALAA